MIPEIELEIGYYKLASKDLRKLREMTYEMEMKMTKSQNTKNEQQKITSEQLTEQRKKGELPIGWYYTKLWKGCNVIDYFIGNQFLRYDDSDIVEVIAPVPSYDEYKDLKSKLQLKDTAYDFDTARLEEQNAQLKELLKECQNMIAFKHEVYEEDALIKEIDEVLK